MNRKIVDNYTEEKGGSGTNHRDQRGEKDVEPKLFTIYLMFKMYVTGKSKNVSNVKKGGEKLDCVRFI